ncbi:uncharacterized protein LOC134532775 [Bacillus rossius redtenbacheri]|uniref:uncharacterized protein LOC134532775 n=1 Tax=Bacillus rossius redtenbacheri TaxID=93214 RepID=UPI002FDEC6B6
MAVPQDAVASVLEMAIGRIASSAPVLCVAALQMLPPREELLEAGAGQLRWACFDLECTGLDLHAEMLQLAACAGPAPPASSFSCYVLPPTRRVGAGAEALTGLRVEGRGCARALLDTRSGERLDALPERAALLRFVAWLRQLRGAGAGLVLVSHGAVLLDVPVLLLALRRTGLAEHFAQVVVGFCDSNAVFRSDKSIQKYSLQHLYGRFVGWRDESHRAEQDAADLFTVLLKYFNTTELSLGEAALARCTYTTDCMLRHVAWLEWAQPHRAPLRRLLARCPQSSARLRKGLLRNLLAAGLTREALAELRGDPQALRARVQQQVADMKQRRESYLTDTADVSAEQVAAVVSALLLLPQ